MFKNQQVLVAGYEVSKVFVSMGLHIEEPIFNVTWGQVAKIIGDLCTDKGLPIDRLDENELYDLAQQIKDALNSTDVLSWDKAIQDTALSHPALSQFLNDELNNDDEGPLTEQFENATRTMDDEGFWPDGGASAGWDE
jgi:hypothetical protein